jgi:hypothetical protein
LQPQIRNVIQFGHICAVFQHFTRAHKRLRIVPGAHSSGWCASVNSAASRNAARRPIEPVWLRKRPGRQRAPFRLMIRAEPVVGSASADQQRQNEHHANDSETHARSVPRCFPAKLNPFGTSSAYQKAGSVACSLRLISKESAPVGPTSTPVECIRRSVEVFGEGFLWNCSVKIVTVSDQMRNHRVRARHRHFHAVHPMLGYSFR